MKFQFMYGQFWLITSETPDLCLKLIGEGTFTGGNLDNASIVFEGKHTNLVRIDTSKPVINTLNEGLAYKNMVYIVR